MTACSSRDARAAKVERAAAPNGFCGTSIILRAKPYISVWIADREAHTAVAQKDWSQMQENRL